MSVLEKLMRVRKEFHRIKIEKTGYNTYSQYSYFKLSDFLIHAMDLFEYEKLASHTWFTHELATMRITDLEDMTFIDITSPMSSASLKAAHEIQNLGAVQTYLRRYLWIAALEIIENDQFEDKKPDTGGKIKHSAKDSPLVAQERVKVLEKAFQDIVGMLNSGAEKSAFDRYQQFADVEERTWLWGKMNTQMKGVLRKIGKQEQA